MTKRILTVRFQNGSGRYSYASAKEYCYVYNGDKNVEKNDIAVVNSPFRSWICTVVTAVRDATDFDVGLEEVAEVISLSEQRAAAKREKRKAELKKQLKKMVTEAHEMKLLEAMAADNPEAEALLKELKALG